MSALARLLEGLDRRTGWRAAKARAAEELGKPVPPRVGWGWTVGTSALVLLAVQVATGVALAFHYQASPEAAHRSVAEITDNVRLGWLIRGAHVWGSTFLIALLLLHAAKVFVTAGHKRPRELTWVVGALILLVMLGLAFSGHLLPWTDLSYWGTVVGLEQVRTIPLVGPPAAGLLQGGADVGAPTLSRFYVLHILVLPALLLALLAAHLFLVRRLGVAPAESVTEEEARGHAALCEAGAPYVPHHALKEAAAATVVLGALLTAAALWPADMRPRAGHETPHGLRPDWYFLAVYQYLKYWPSRLLGLPGEALAILSAHVPLAAFVFLPFLDRSPERAPRRRKLALALFAAAAILWIGFTLLGAVADRDVDAFGRTWRFDTYGRLR
jgi:quinol-cytochrome oxidoreductase complex cytochrome b subunit